jgi:hypothetical protein
MCTKSGTGLALEAMRLVPQSVGLARLAPKQKTKPWPFFVDVDFFVKRLRRDVFIKTRLLCFELPSPRNTEKTRGDETKPRKN